ncbi:MAG: NAD(P)/FAD-dependent oxidoreductase [Saprospiraceae bacterium]|nr:NAD(P)/FAD-dependent oxidoreductase [Saprospiraceae bacterium]
MKQISYNNIAIVGGGAAGFFAAITVAENYPLSNVVIFEKSTKVLSKVKISGGGRCNLTNACSSLKELSNAYPRGQKMLKKAFNVFNNKDTMQWFESRGVPVIVQEDNCVFPVSQSSKTVIDCFLRECNKLGIKIEVQKGVIGIEQTVNGKLKLFFSKEINQPLIFDKVIVATGGCPKRSGLVWLEKLGHKIEEPVPSLFTFNMPDEPIKKLMGVVVEKNTTSIQGTKLKSNGPLLITHWGMSGPSILKLSAFGARILNSMNYKFKIQVNWVNEKNNEKVYNYLKTIILKYPKKQLINYRPYFLPQRLWTYLLEKSSVLAKKKWEEIGKKDLNKIVSILCNDIYSVSGKTTFKEEFVTCGGLSLESIDTKTMESKVCKNLYFAGEVIDVDGITGGYNFQAAWTTAYIAAKLL